MYGYTAHGVIGATLAFISTTAVLYSLYRLLHQQDTIQTQQDRLLKQQESLLKQNETQQVDSRDRIAALRGELGELGVVGRETGETLLVMRAVVEELKERARVKAEKDESRSDPPGRSTPFLASITDLLILTGPHTTVFSKCIIIDSDIRIKADDASLLFFCFFCSSMYTVLQLDH
ncbi:hypothetical protein BJ165DRAFT_1531845 [Panaeolus papilionaceus]|nr:hypothetical protein BJ165DRAFT_1531845 [Panaeolus papilionaceus]